MRLRVGELHGNILPSGQLVIQGLTILPFLLAFGFDILIFALQNFGLLELRLGFAGLTQLDVKRLSLLQQVFGQRLRGGWQPRRVCLEHSAPRDVSVHHRLFGPCVEFDADFNCIVCAKSDLDARNPSADPAMARYASGKATLKFPLDAPLPLGLIATVVKAKVRVASVAKKKTPKAAAGSR